MTASERVLPYSGLANEIDENNLQNMKHETVNQQFSAQSRIINDFWNRWRLEYFTSLREQHKSTGVNMQDVKVSDVVQIYDDAPRTM